jgi:amidase
MTDLVFWPVHQLAQAIHDRTVSSLEVLNAYLQQIEKHNARLNAIVTLNTEPAIAQAKAADEALARGEDWGALHGVPITFKDLFETEGVRTTFSCKPCANYIPRQDVEVVKRMRAAGAILLGKTNLPYRGADFQTNSPIFGRTHNPWNLDYTPGGSTGGGAAAIAAGLSPLEIGNDLGGSLRIPAHFCGIYGLKPTEHRVPYSQRTYPRQVRYMLGVGPMARSVEDLKLALSVIEGADGQEWEIPPLVREDAKCRGESPKVVYTDQFGDVPVDQQTRDAIAGVVSKLSSQGWIVEAQQPKAVNFGDLWQTYGELCGCQIGLVKNDLLRAAGRRVIKTLPPDILPDGPIAYGILRGATLSLEDYRYTLTQRDRFTRLIEQFLKPWDAWICPVTPGPAFTHRATHSWLRPPLEVDKQRIPYWTWGMSYTSLFSLTGNPVVTLPIAVSAQGLPIGIQLVGKRWQDYELLAIAQKMMDIMGKFPIPPGNENIAYL